MVSNIYNQKQGFFQHFHEQWVFCHFCSWGVRGCGCDFHSAQQPVKWPMLINQTVQWPHGPSWRGGWMVHTLDLPSSDLGPSSFCALSHQNNLMMLITVQNNMYTVCQPALFWKSNQTLLITYYCLIDQRNTSMKVYWTWIWLCYSALLAVSLVA